MADIEEQIEALMQQLTELKNRQMQVTNEITLLQKQLDKLKFAVFPNANHTPYSVDNTIETQLPLIHELKQNSQKKAAQQSKRSFHINRETEDFIGTNIISKIGILVTIIGVFIGAKYAIDKDLISPVIRIAAGYCAAAILVFVALRLKKKYQYFSSVLLGGGLAIIYFITYIAFSYFALLPAWLAFVIMVITTAAAVGISLWYNQKVIALIGQVAAYAIPFLLGNKSGNIFGLFTYISVINVGLLILSLKKDWKTLYHIAFFLTWAIYFFWLISATQIQGNFSAGLFFLTITFFTFYVTFLAYKFFTRQQYKLGEISILLLNAFFYFFSGLYLINEDFQNIHFLTYFTVVNAFIHFAAGYFIYRLQLTDTTVFKFVSGLGLLFVTVAIPIDLDGNWVTLLWTAEAAILFYVASANRRAEYLDISLPLVIIAVVSLLQDWSYNYPFMNGLSGTVRFHTSPFANSNFWLSLFVCACLGYISYAAQSKAVTGINSIAAHFFSEIIPIAFLLILYFTLYNEIHFVWDKIIYAHPAKANIIAAKTFPLYCSLTLMIYSCLYISFWFFSNVILIKKKINNYLFLAVGAIATAVIITKGLYLAGELREIYIANPSPAAFSTLHLYRYILFAALAILWISAYRSFKTFNPSYLVRVAFSSLFNLALLTVICNEFIHWMDLAGYQNQYKLGLSLICGGYALALIFAGIIKNKKHLRISALLLFSVTLFKLFFYDLASLSTISKTIVLVLLGILLLFASFLYNKYKDAISAKGEN